MSLISLQNVSFTWGHPVLLEEINLEIEKGERIGLVGRNGAGKSTLMKILTGEIVPDSGSIQVGKGVRIVRLVQEVPTDRSDETTIAQLIESEYRQRIADQEEAHVEDWKVHHDIERVLSRMKLDGTARFASLSSGMKRRALLAAALSTDPQVLLLDEPTNHLDIESIAWLEQFLSAYDATIVFVTHDRAFLQALANRIIEIDRGHLYDWTCDYKTFLERKNAALEAEEKQNALFDKKLAEEEAWIRQGIKARRTRNEGRVRALKEMREERRQRRERVQTVRAQIGEAEKSGQLVLQAKNISFSYPGRTIIDDFSVLVSRGDKIGVIGPNGAGKTTLLKLLLGDLEPTSGTIRHGTRLEIVYFDQLREQINEDQTVVENVGQGQDTVEINGKKQHIYGYLQDFLFTPERARRPVRFLSGGERNRLLLARLFKRPSNVMVLDEPTNDLDMETLELLEELVANYTGTVLMVSHDREFLNNVVTSTLVVTGDGQVKEFVGGYDDYLRQREEPAAAKQPEPTAKPKPAPAPARPAKLSFKERKQLESLPEQIEKLEQEQQAIHASMADPSFFKKDGAEIAKVTARLQELESELADLFEQWESLESRS